MTARKKLAGYLTAQLLFSQRKNYCKFSVLNYDELKQDSKCATIKNKINVNFLFNIKLTIPYIEAINSISSNTGVLKSPFKKNPSVNATKRNIQIWEETQAVWNGAYSFVSAL
ncbi:hypothetical protein BpHYR1_048770 [Brachionus plicatilis]|uniref:Uncharacterized protein n=1 Tax=Brachionus plicatilis TaxID=10195 RepID=A0A3M7PPT7_BRAPC|nr:hypothetical protein BpHYR1_048770 [Brachionus plicatilis]